MPYTPGGLTTKLSDRTTDMSQPETQRHNPEAQPGSLLVRLVVSNHTPEELALGYLRYEAVRKMSARTFGELCKRNLDGERFDDLVTDAIESWNETWKPNARTEPPAN